MSNKTLLIKGAIRHDDDSSEVQRLRVSRYDPYGYNNESSVFEIHFYDDGNNKILSLEFVNLYDACYLRDVVYLGDEWSVDGLLMAISVSFHLTRFKRFIIVGSYLFETITRIFSNNYIFREITLMESEHNGSKAYHINYSFSEIMVIHHDDAFAITPDETILDCALENNVELKHMCKAGICMKCRKKIRSGACMTTSSQEENSMVKVQHILTCNYKALTSLIIG
ncbi:2Fe-2S iron-sulfur cluster-binding protein [Serratia microhaemolytica]|uniref:2Fe-2S iron-sulfur cluster-binding protein n=1 Tax=Serratia microhaemolytica TaxID=2675110 RepID=UPI0013923B34|nr:2Fe-2S iron-sulfur cluster-binding protein [Serratia microhaemolytica]